MAAGKALSATTRLRPNLSDKLPRQKEPNILATLSTLITQPASFRLKPLAVRSSVGVQAAEAQNTEPPINSATARIRIAKDNASRNEPERAAVRLGRTSRIHQSCTSMSAAPMTPTPTKAVRQPNAAVTRLASRAPTAPPMP